jgi:hypothetical protein
VASPISTIGILFVFLFALIEILNLKGKFTAVRKTLLVLPRQPIGDYLVIMRIVNAVLASLRTLLLEN